MLSRLNNGPRCCDKTTLEFPRPPLTAQQRPPHPSSECERKVWAVLVPFWVALRVVLEDALKVVALFCWEKFIFLCDTTKRWFTRLVSVLHLRGEWIVREGEKFAKLYDFKINGMTQKFDNKTFQKSINHNKQICFATIIAPLHSISQYSSSVFSSVVFPELIRFINDEVESFVCSPHKSS